MYHWGIKYKQTCHNASFTDGSVDPFDKTDLVIFAGRWNTEFLRIFYSNHLGFFLINVVVTQERKAVNCFDTCIIHLSSCFFRLCVQKLEIIFTEGSITIYSQWNNQLKTNNWHLTLCQKHITLPESLRWLTAIILHLMCASCPSSFVNICFLKH